EVPDDLAAVLGRMLAKDREQRYPDPATVAVALAPWTHEPVPPPTTEELPPLCPAAGGPPLPPTSNLSPAAPELLPTSQSDGESASEIAPDTPASGDASPVARENHLMPVSTSAATAIATLPKQEPKEAIQERSSRDTDPAIEPANTLSALPVF